MKDYIHKNKIAGVLSFSATGRKYAPYTAVESCLENFYSAGGRSGILLKARRIFGHGEEAPSLAEETSQTCFAKNQAGRKRFKRSTPSGALKINHSSDWNQFINLEASVNVLW